MSKDKKIPKEYAIVVSLIIFFTIVIFTGGVRIYLITKDRLARVDLANIDVIEFDTNIDMASYNLRIVNSMQEAYAIDIYYGSIPGLESVSATAVTDDIVIFNMLRKLNSALAQYPKNLIREIESKGYEISIYLVEQFKTNVEALANRNSIGQMKIYMSNTADLERAIHHELYHILDYYIKLESSESLVYRNWNKYNPDGFEYVGNIDSITPEYVYAGLPGAYFVTAYAKYSDKEDRAETFAEMLTASKEELFFNEEGAIKGKIEVIKKALYDNFNSVKLEDKLAWE